MGEQETLVRQQVAVLHSQPMLMELIFFVGPSAMELVVQVQQILQLTFTSHQRLQALELHKIYVEVLPVGHWEETRLLLEPVHGVSSVVEQEVSVHQQVAVQHSLLIPMEHISYNGQSAMVVVLQVQQVLQLTSIKHQQ